MNVFYKVLMLVFLSTVVAAPLLAPPKPCPKPAAAAAAAPAAQAPAPDWKAVRTAYNTCKESCKKAVSDLCGTIWSCLSGKITGTADGLKTHWDKYKTVYVALLTTAAWFYLSNGRSSTPMVSPTGLTPAAPLPLLTR